MGTIRRRDFLRRAALAGPLLAGGSRAFLWGRQKKEEKGLIVLKNKCTGCKACVGTCPVDAISMKDGVAFIDTDECIECDVCIDECPAEAIIYKSELPQNQPPEKAKTEPVKKDELPKLDAEKPAAAAAFNVAGLWIITGTFTDGSAPSREEVQFIGTGDTGVMKTANAGPDQGRYKITGAQIELRLPGNLICWGRIVSADRMEGDLPQGAGKWRAERKR